MDFINASDAVLCMGRTPHGILVIHRTASDAFMKSIFTSFILPVGARIVAPRTIVLWTIAPGTITLRSIALRTIALRTIALGTISPRTIVLKDGRLRRGVPRMPTSLRMRHLDDDDDNDGTCHWGLGKVALVTGSARRVGKVIASSLHKHGYNVVIHCNSSREEADAFACEMNKDREDSAFVICGDLSKNVGETCRRLVTEAVGKWGRLDLLVNNAALFLLTPIDTASEEQWDQLLDTNVKAPYFLSQVSSGAAASYLRQTKGNIINLCDVIGEQASPPHTIYSISKAALIMATKNLGIELGPEIRVNYICPGVVMWPEVEQDYHNDNFRKVRAQEHMRWRMKI
ncbi:hypothetical protein SK128_001470 [Halocaridina rubra]|uniref:Uncharacterized protein n=1 Tax=Halocaridina rubra TaxID=373956 RepID=A0AAN8WM75_HALRR